MTPIKLSRPNIDEAAISKVVEVLASGNLVYGSVGRAFEDALANYVDSSHCVVVSSGATAIYLALVALGIGQGDVVLVPNFTFPATANAVCLAGATPLLVDVDPATYCMDPITTERVIQEYGPSQKIKAILLVHEFGTPCDMAGFRALSDKYGLKLIEDAACALGAKSSLGMIGKGSDIACFSFHPRKTLTTGEGGALITDNAVLADRLKILRNHGMKPSDSGVDFVEPALNFRLTDFQSALGLSQLPKLNDWIRTRHQLADIYFERLADLAAQGHLTLPAKVAGQSWQTFMVVLADNFDRRAIISAMAAQGIETNLGAQCLSSTTAFKSALGQTNLTVSPKLGKQGLALPMCETLVASDIERIVTALSSCLNA